jgi:hypothetical protein
LLVSAHNLANLQTDDFEPSSTVYLSNASGSVQASVAPSGAEQPDIPNGNGQHGFEPPGDRSQSGGDSRVGQNSRGFAGHRRVNPDPAQTGRGRVYL